MNSVATELLGRIRGARPGPASSVSAMWGCRSPSSSPGPAFTPPASIWTSARSKRSPPGDPTFRMCRPRDVAAAPAGRHAATPRPTSLSSRASWTRSTSACRRRCGRRRIPTCRTSSSAVESIARHLHPGMLVVLESTTYPGTTEEVVQPLLEASGLKAGKDFFLAFSPERVDPGQPDVPDPQRAEGRRRADARVHRAGAPLCTRLRDRDHRAGELDARRRDGQAAREHVPRGQHRRSSTSWR